MMFDLLLTEQQAMLEQRVNFSPLNEVRAAGIEANFSRHWLSPSAWQQLLSLAHKAGLNQSIGQLFAGEPINSTQRRPVLHTALRRPLAQPLFVGEQNVMLEISAALDQMQAIVEPFQQQQTVGDRVERITDVIHIGIGGSDLGPMMLHHALQPYVKSPARWHFFANIDSAYLQQCLAKLNPSSTLVIVVSKSFSTVETLTNARWVRLWMHQSGLSDDFINDRFCAVTANQSAAQEFGIDVGRILPLWDWVGGRFSIWSAVSLSVAMAIGMPRFRELLEGAHAMDLHFQQADWSSNMPVIMGLLAVWYGNVCQAPTQAVVGYSEYLRHFTDYLQQLHMESLGKRVSCQGEELPYSTGRILWGGVGTNSQHSFHQLLLQGSHWVPIDFILPTHQLSGQRNDALIAHCLAQAEVLWNGQSNKELSRQLKATGLSQVESERLLAHQVIPGRCPSTLLMLDQLSPYRLGALIALYEHSVFVSSVVWNINAFDQWGVEAGKVMAKQILHSLQTGEVTDVDDPVTRSLLSKYGEKIETC